MSENYFISRKQQAYFGYARKQKRRWANVFKIAAFGSTLLAVVFLIIIFVFPQDNLAAYAPAKAPFYLHLSDTAGAGQRDLAGDFNTLFGFPRELMAEEMSWLITPEGQRILLLFFSKTAKQNKIRQDILANYPAQFLNEKVLAVWPKERKEELKVPTENLLSNFKNRFFFSRPSRSWLTAYMSASGLTALLDRPFKYQLPASAEYFYIRGFAKKDKMLFYLSGGSAGEPPDKFIWSDDLPRRAVLSWRGLPVKNLAILWKGWLTDYSAAFPLTGNSQVIVLSKLPENSPRTRTDFLNPSAYEYLLVVKQDNFERTLFEERVREITARLFPQEKEKILLDGTVLPELFLDKERFVFTDKEGMRLLSYGRDFEVAYGNFSRAAKNYTAISNSFILLREFIKTGKIQGANKKINKKICGQVNFLNWSVYVNSQFISEYSRFLANFREIIFSRDNKKICFY